MPEIDRGSFHREEIHIDGVTVSDVFKVQGVTVVAMMSLFHDAISLFWLKFVGVHLIGRRSSE